MANECIPYKEPGSATTFKATAGVTGKRFVAPSGNRTGGAAGGLSSDLANVLQCAHAGAGVKPLGVAKRDVANGALGGAHATPGMVVPVTAGATITAGQEVMSDASGQAIPHVPGTATNRAAGLALTGAANGADAEIRLY